jgi:hypothetical protein
LKIEKNNTIENKFILNNNGKWYIIIDDDKNISCNSFINDNLIKCNIDNLIQKKKSFKYSYGNILLKRNIILKESISNNLYNISIINIPYNYFNVKLIVRNDSILFYFEGYYLLNDTNLYCIFMKII